MAASAITIAPRTAKRGIVEGHTRRPTPAGSGNLFSLPLLLLCIKYYFAGPRSIISRQELYWKASSEIKHCLGTGRIITRKRKIFWKRPSPPPPPPPALETMAVAAMLKKGNLFGRDLFLLLLPFFRLLSAVLFSTLPFLFITKIYSKWRIRPEFRFSFRALMRERRWRWLTAQEIVKERSFGVVSRDLSLLYSWYGTNTRFRMFATNDWRMKGEPMWILNRVPVLNMYVCVCVSEWVCVHPFGLCILQYLRD